VDRGKVSFLLYDLKTRLGIDAVATCSALTASASRAQHFNALSQLEKILGVRCFDSPAEFADWLRPGAELELPRHSGGFEPLIEAPGRPSALRIVPSSPTSSETARRWTWSRFPAVFQGPSSVGRRVATRWATTRRRPW
jgi:hypothetical protein